MLSLESRCDRPLAYVAPGTRIHRNLAR
jgi:hypothetical protein